MWWLHPGGKKKRMGLSFFQNKLYGWKHRLSYFNKMTPKWIRFMFLLFDKVQREAVRVGRSAIWPWKCSFHLWTKAAILVIVIPASGKREWVRGVHMFTLAGTCSRSRIHPLARLWAHVLTKLQERLGNTVISSWPCAQLKFEVLLLKKVRTNVNTQLPVSVK